MNKLFELFGQPIERMSKDFKRTGKPFVRVNKSLEQFAWPFERMHKTDNVERTGKPFKRVKIILLIRMIGCAIGLPIERMLKWFSKPFRAHGLIMKQAMLLCIVFISFVVVVNFKAFILTIENGDYFNFLSK